MSNSINPTSLARELSVSKTVTARSRTLLRGRIADLQENLSSGLRVNRPSDDPIDFEKARRLERFNKEVDQYDRSVQTAQNWNQVTQASLDQLADLFTEAYETAIQAANDTNSDDERSALVERLRGIKSSAVDELNSKVGDEFVFAGNNTLQKPFIDDPADPNYGQVIDPAAPPAPAPDYTDFDGDRMRHIGPDLQVKVNKTAQDVHQLLPGAGTGTTIVDALDNLIEAIDPTTPDPAPLPGTGSPYPAPGPADQQEAIQNGIHVISLARDHLIDKGAEAGETGRRLQLAEQRLADVSLKTTEQQSEIEEADFAETITDYQRNQNSLQAALRVQSTADRISLLDYI